MAPASTSTSASAPPPPPPPVAEQVRAALDSVAEPVVVVGRPEMRILYGNRPACELLAPGGEGLEPGVLVREWLSPLPLWPSPEDTTDEGLKNFNSDSDEEDEKEDNIKYDLKDDKHRSAAPASGWHKTFLRRRTRSTATATATNDRDDEEIDDEIEDEEEIEVSVGKLAGNDNLLVLTLRRCINASSAAAAAAAASSVSSSRYYNEFEELEFIGKGGFGAVFRVKNRLDGKEYAVKKVPLSCSPSELREFSVFHKAAAGANGHEHFKKRHARKISGADKRLLSEVQMFASLSDHPNVTRYYASWCEPVTENDKRDLVASDEEEDDDINRANQHKSTLYIQMQLCLHRDLTRWLRERVQPNEIENLQIVKQVAEALKHCHERGVVHRDITSSNIFVGKDIHVYLGDFGLAKSVTDHMLDCSIVSPDQSSPFGTYFYAAPEHGGIITTKSDIYSLGILCIELWSKFETAMERAMVLSAFKNSRTLPPHILSDPLLSSLILSMTDPDPQNRPTAELVLHDVIFDKLDEYEWEREESVGFSRRRAASCANVLEGIFTGSPSSWSAPGAWGSLHHSGSPPLTVISTGQSPGEVMSLAGYFRSDRRRTLSNGSLLFKSDEETLVDTDDYGRWYHQEDLHDVSHPTPHTHTCPQSHSHTQPHIYSHTTQAHAHTHTGIKRSMTLASPSCGLTAAAPIKSDTRTQYSKNLYPADSGTVLPISDINALTEDAAKYRIRELDKDVAKLTEMLERCKREKGALEALVNHN